MTRTVDEYTGHLNETVAALLHAHPDLLDRNYDRAKDGDVLATVLSFVSLSYKMNLFDMPDGKEVLRKAVTEYLTMNSKPSSPLLWYRKQLQDRGLHDAGTAPGFTQCREEATTLLVDAITPELVTRYCGHVLNDIAVALKGELRGIGNENATQQLLETGEGQETITARIYNYLAWDEPKRDSRCFSRAPVAVPNDKPMPATPTVTVEASTIDPAEVEAERVAAEAIRAERLAERNRRLHALSYKLKPRAGSHTEAAEQKGDFSPD